MFTCPRCGCHTLQYKTLVPLFNTITSITRERASKIFPLNKHDDYTYNYDLACENEYDYDQDVDDGVVCSHCGMHWASFDKVVLSGCVQTPCGGGVSIDENNDKISFIKVRHMKTEHILGVNVDGNLVVLTHLVHNFCTLHSARVAVMKPLTMEDVEDARKHQEPEVCRQFWQEAVAAGDTEQSLEEFSADLVSNERGLGGKLFVGDDDTLRHETTYLFEALDDETRNKLLQAMGVSALVEVDTLEAHVRDANGNLPVVAFSCEYTGDLEHDWTDGMKILTLDNDALDIVAKYTGTEPMSDDENKELHKAWNSSKNISND